MQTFLRKVAMRLQPALISALLFAMAASAGGPLIVFNEARSSESQEDVPLSERQEEFTPISRFDHERHLKQELRQLAIVVDVPTAHLGHAQNAVFFVPSGHRLANGLLAPLTC